MQASTGSQPVVLHSTWNGGNASASFGDPMVGSGGSVSVVGGFPDGGVSPDAM
jgi:hypothetical protein